MKSDVARIQSEIGKQRDRLRSVYKVKTIGVFGSVARGEETGSSDLDVLVEFSEPTGFFKFLELEEFLTKIVGRRVDLVTKQGLKPVVKEEILRQVVYV